MTDIIRTQEAIATATAAQLVATYNALAGKEIKKFETRAIAEARVRIGTPGRKTKIYPVNPIAAKGVLFRPRVVQSRKEHMRMGQLDFCVDLKLALLPMQRGRPGPAVRCRRGL